MSSNRLFVKITRDTLPQIKDKYPFLYLEWGRLEIDDSSIKWLCSTGEIIRLPIATINCLLLGPGTTITHEAVKVATQANCSLCWVGEDSLLFYACGTTPNSDSRNFRKQMLLATDPNKSLIVAKKMFSKRFTDEDLEDRTLQEIMGLEGYRVRKLYEQKAKEYGVGWQGRDFVPGKFEFSDITNKILTGCNAALYGILSAALHSLGYSLHIGFIHSGSPLPFVYDIADLYKDYLCIDLAFSMTLESGGQYNKYLIADEFKKRVVKINLLENLAQDIKNLFGEKNGRSRSK